MPAVGAAVTAVAGFLGSTAFTIGTVAVSWGTVLMTTTSLASGLIAAGKKPSGAVADPGRNIGIGVDAFMPRKCVYGRAAVSGDRIFADTYSSNQKLGQVLALSIGMISGVDTVMMNETEISLSGTSVTTAPWNGVMSVEFKNGTDAKTAYSGLAAGSSYWTTNHRGRGVSDVFWELTYDQEKYSGGIPVPLFIGDYALVYDPRKDSSIGGDGTHRHDDPTTWEFSDSGPLQALHYLIGIYQNGKRVWGLGVPVDLIDIDSFAAAADVCEYEIEGKPRFTTGGRISDDDDPREVLDSFAASFGGAIYPSGGLIRCMAAAPVTATLTLTDDDLDGGIEYVGNQAWRDAVNTVRVSFTDPNRDWRQNTTSDISDPDYVEADGDEVLDDEYPVPLCNDGDCAHRLGRLYLANKREPRTIRARWKVKAFRLREGLTVNVNSVRLGVNEKMMVIERSLRPDGTVELTLRTETDAKYGAMDDFSQDMPSFGRVDRYDPTDVDTPVSEDWSAVAAYVANDDETSKIPVIRVSGGTTDPLIASVLVEYRKTGDANWSRWQESGNPSSVLMDISGLASGTSYDVAVRYRNVKGVLGDRLGLSPVTTGTDFIVTSAGGLGDRTAEQVIADLDARELEAEQNAQNLIAEAIDRYEKVMRRRDEITAAREEAFASYSLERSERIAADEAEITTRETQIAAVNSAISLVEQETVTNANALSTFASQTNTQLSAFNDNLALVESNITTVSDDLSALTSTVNTQFSAVDDSIAAVQSQVTTNASAISAEVTNRQNAVATVSGNLASLQSDYDLTASEVDSLGTSFTSLSATVTSQGNTLSAVSSDLTTVQASVDSLEATRIQQVATGATYAGVLFSAVESGGDAASDIRFAAGKLGFGTDYADPDMVFDMVSRSRYVWNAARTHKTIEEDWSDGRLRLRKADGTLVFDSATGLLPDGLPAESSTQVGNTGSDTNVTVSGWTVIAQSSITGMLASGVVKGSGYFAITTSSPVSGNSWRLRLSASGETTTTIAEGQYQTVDITGLGEEAEGIVNFSAEGETPFGGNTTLSLEVFGSGAASGRVTMTRSP